ncbi:MAG: hypothetical protein FLDDKLPJ_01479 [Phycisphaerae bacterium]|nr:hypothetical protein [Phycisphaerae bacterium]
MNEGRRVLRGSGWLVLFAGALSYGQDVCVYEITSIRPLSDPCGIEICPDCPYSVGDLVCDARQATCIDGKGCESGLSGLNACAGGGVCKVRARLVGCMPCPEFSQSCEGDPPCGAPSPAEKTWIHGRPGDWFTANHWRPRCPPTEMDDATINNAGTAQLKNAEMGGVAKSLTLGADAKDSGIVEIEQSSLTVGARIQVGRKGKDNRLSILRGGVLTGVNGVIGGTPTSTDNEVEISGQGAKWLCSGLLFVGDEGARNRLTIAEGGKASALLDVIIGSADSNDNTVVVSGEGATLSTASTLRLGNIGATNRLVIEQQAVAITPRVDISGSLASTVNSATVRDGGRWDIPALEDGDGVLLLGRIGSRNFVEVFSGGRITCKHLRLGERHTSENNALVVEGRGSRVETEGLAVGEQGKTNVVIIRGKGKVNADLAIIGNTTGSDGNSVDVSAKGLLDVEEDLVVGFGGKENILRARADGVVRSGRGFIGQGKGSNGNLVTLTGRKSGWVLLGGLSVGNSGRDNSMLVDDRAHVDCTALFLGGEAGADANKVFVAAGGSVRATDGVVLGGTSTGNEIVVSSAGMLKTNLSVNLGVAAAATGNILRVEGFVEGSGPSRVEAAGDIFVGRESASNQLIIKNGALVTCSSAVIGDRGPSNTATVDSPLNGAKSELSVARNLVVGFASSSNVLNIENDAIVRSRGVYLGFEAGANDNRITFDGRQWSIGDAMARGTLHVGVKGSDNRVTLHRGVSRRPNVTLGTDDGANGNKLELILPMQAVQSLERVTVGVKGRRNEILVTSGEIQALGLIIGGDEGSSENKVFVSALAKVTVSNLNGDAVLDVRRGILEINGGAVKADQLLVATGASGTVSFPQGALEPKKTVVGNGSEFVVGDGTNKAVIILNGADHSFANGLRIKDKSEVHAAGKVKAGPLFFNAGVFKIGQSPGSLTIEGTLMLDATSHLEIELGGLEPGLEHDHLDVTTADALIGGELSVSFLNGFEGNVTSVDEFTILSAESGINGEFLDIPHGGRVPTADGHGSFTVHYEANRVVLREYLPN